jgi:membrane protease YdiL (CAAX protease family)
VTLVVAPSSSGQPEPVPKGRQWAATLGAFSFATGVITRNWHLAALGVMFSTLTSAAMWQNFRERLPYLFDPDSERLPPPPTLMHAMVAITAMVDGMGFVVVAIALALGSEGAWVAPAAAYGIAAFVTWLVTSTFLTGRGVTSARIWAWPAGERSRGPAFVDRMATGVSREALAGVAAALGVMLGGLALGYEWGLSRIPAVAEQLAPATKYLAEHPEERWGLVLASVAFAPVAEEYLFRGLLFRALDHEWGGWRAVVGSALFFAVYHPPLSWIPVGLVGLVLALLFKTTGRLWPCVMLHAVYNATVTLAL